MSRSLRTYSFCGFSSLMSNSQVKCPPDVQLDMKVRMSTVLTVHRDDHDGLDGPKRAVVSLCCVWTGSEGGGGASCLQQICGIVSASKHRVLDECRPHRRQQESCTSATTSLVVTAAAIR
jgi:hypothetical protein